MTKIIIALVLIAAEACLGYYSMAVSGSLISRFLFFLLSAVIVCIIVIWGIPYVLPGENHRDYDEEEEAKE